MKSVQIDISEERALTDGLTDRPDVFLQFCYCGHRGIIGANYSVKDKQIGSTLKKTLADGQFAANWDPFYSLLPYLKISSTN